MTIGSGPLGLGPLGAPPPSGAPAASVFTSDGVGAASWVGVVPASVFTSDGVGAASWVGVVPASVFTSDGVGAASWVGVGGDSVFTSAGVASVLFVGPTPAASVFTSDGVGAVSWAGVVPASVFTSAGVGAASWVASSGVGVFTSAGVGTASWVASAIPASVFTSAGTGAASWVRAPVPASVLTSAGVGVATFFSLGLRVQAEIQGLTPSARIELFELDTAVLGGPIYRFHAGTNALREPVTWNGEQYSPFPVQANGFDYSGQGPLPRPKFRVANVAGVMSSLVTLYDDLAGCKVTRIRTLAKFLDAVNFPSGNPTADPEAEYPREVYFIDRKASEDRDMVEFELASSLDMAGVMFPSRQVVQNYCPWAYRGPECGYTGTNYFDTNDQVVAVAGQDVCGKRLSSCRKRFGQYGELSYGGFPAAGLLRV